MSGDHRYGVDHGLTFHVDGKQRTVLWGRLGEALSEEERDSVGRVLEGSTVSWGPAGGVAGCRGNRSLGRTLHPVVRLRTVPCPERPDASRDEGSA